MEVLPGQPRLESRSACLGKRLVSIHESVTGLVHSDPLASGWGDLVVDIQGQEAARTLRRLCWLMDDYDAALSCRFIIPVAQRHPREIEHREAGLAGGKPGATTAH